MKKIVRMLVPSLLALGLASPVAALPTPAEALDAAMTPGPAQARLNDLIGTFDVTISIWVTPRSTPVVANAAAVATWVLDGRYVQTTLSGFVDGQAYNAMGYAGYDNVGKVYQATWMDNASTAQTWYKGGFTPGSKAAVMTATILNAVTGKPEPLELRLTIDKDGNHVSELWGNGGGKTVFKMMELRYVRSKS